MGGKGEDSGGGEVVLCCLPVGNGLVNKVEFLGLIPQKGL